MTLNIAHRGFSAYYPENTMLAFTKAKEEGFCHGIELDVQLTKDNIPVIIHDENLDRTTDGHGLIKDFTYKSLRTLDAGKGEKIPSLEEFLEFCKAEKLLINLELKNSIIDYKDIEEKVLALIYKYNLASSTIISSFNHYSMVKIKKLDKNIKTGLLYDACIFKAEEYCLKCSADALHPFYFSLFKDNVVENIHNNGILLNPYTVNSENNMKKLIDLKVNGIITNYPDKLNKLLNIK